MQTIYTQIERTSGAEARMFLVPLVQAWKDLLQPARNRTGKIHRGAVRSPSHISTTLFFNSAVSFA